MRKRRAYNIKKRIQDTLPSMAYEELSGRARYGGNPEHKRNPGDFELTPPANPRPDKSLCDEVGIFRKSEAERLLREGIRRGLVSMQERRGFPQNIWAVTKDGRPVEAQLENAEQGVYHGYPMPLSDPFFHEVLLRWEASNG